MSRDEAARSGAEGAEGSAPKDERPRPRYGEYAPEGWTWQPPAESTADPAPDASPATPSGGAQRGPGGAPGAPVAFGTGAPAAAHPVDRGWTLALLVFGAIGAVYNSLTILAMPDTALESAQLSAQMLGTEPPTAFEPGPGVPALIAVGIALQLALWVGALMWSRSRLRAGRITWWVPVVAGVAAFIVVIVVGMLVFASDPGFLPAVGSLTST
ncbi:hypothetical protein GE115_13785 [Agromyces sp. CFH 90414]|uniref:Uncharacterized protein n=1 Tax=Agromyces agglutinans TaxID=2662258 RepID=A0A6I2FAT1_9MICO|nr:DUF6264 family protein [Agromyces agglutinans]MRG60927.1 hypothetical protein [Agromyces agglutinans]